jgi:hypothetical protein
MTFMVNVKRAAFRNLAVAFGCLLLLMAADFLSVREHCTRGSVAFWCSNWSGILVFFVLPILGFFVANLPLYQQERLPWKYIFPLGWTAFAFFLWSIPAFVFNIWFLIQIGATK